MESPPDSCQSENQCLIGMEISFPPTPLSANDVSSNMIPFDQDEDWEWDNKTSVENDDLAAISDQDKHGVRFDLDNIVRHEAPREHEELSMGSLWFTPDEIECFRSKAACTAEKLSSEKDKVKTCLEGAYKAALQANKESNRSPLKNKERRVLLTQYSKSEDVVGTERDLISSFQCESAMRRFTILKIIHQVSGNNNSPRGKSPPKSKASMLREENAIRVAASRISLPARLFAQEMGQLQVVA